MIEFQFPGKFPVVAADQDTPKMQHQDGRCSSANSGHTVRGGGRTPLRGMHTSCIDRLSEMTTGKKTTVVCSYGQRHQASLRNKLPVQVFTFMLRKDTIGGKKRVVPTCVYLTKLGYSIFGACALLSAAQKYTSHLIAGGNLRVALYGPTSTGNMRSAHYSAKHPRQCLHW